MRSRETTYAIWLGSAMVGWILGGVVAFLLFGCGAKQAAPVLPKQIEVKVVEMPARPSCYFSPRPEAPKLKELDHEIQDVIRRTMIHWHDWNELVQYEQGLVAWAEDVERCLLVLTGAEP